MNKQIRKIWKSIGSRNFFVEIKWIGFILAEFLEIPAAIWFWRKGYRRMEGGKFQ